MSDAEGRIIAVTGPTGHVGVNLVHHLVDAGFRVRALVYDDAPGIDGLEIDRVRGNVLDPATIEAALHDADVVFHLAAVVSLDPRDAAKMHKVNVEGTGNVVAACRQHGVRRLVHFSSIHAISPLPLDGVVDETWPPYDEAKLPWLTPYGLSKASGERLVRDAVAQGLDAVILNPTGIIGPNDYLPSAMGRMILDLYHRRAPALVTGGFNWVDVRDVCQGAIAAAERGRTGKRYILGGNYAGVREFANLCADITGINAPRLTIPLGMARAVVPFAALYGRITHTPPRFTHTSLDALCQHQQVSIEKAREELGYAPRPLRETLEDTYGWFKEAGYLEPHGKY